VKRRNAILRRVHRFALLLPLIVKNAQRREINRRIVSRPRYLRLGMTSAAVKQFLRHDRALKFGGGVRSASTGSAMWELRRFWRLISALSVLRSSAVTNRRCIIVLPPISMIALPA
jgi:hypothetical protein